MRSSWAQPSLSRDFALLSAAILFILFMISAWVTYATYNNHAQRITTELSKESVRIDEILELEMRKASYMLNALGRQIILDDEIDKVKIAHMLKSFDSKGNIYTIFSWVAPDQHIMVSSNRGILEEPVDVSDRDYVQKAMGEPWKMSIGRPIEGRVSGHWVIPVALGLTDYTGKFIGSIMISIDVKMLMEEMGKLVKRDGISFALVSKTLVPLAKISSDDNGVINDSFPIDELTSINFSTASNGMIKKGSLLLGTGNYTYYRASEHYPYIMLIGYDTRFSDETVRDLLWSRLLQMIGMALFFVLFLWLVRARIIRPVLNMTDMIAEVAKGKPYRSIPQGGPIEIEGLARQVKRVSEYIEENKRMEDELRNKMFMLKRAKEQVEMNMRSQSEFLAYVCQEMHVPLNDVSGYAQVMKDQLYGPIENRKYRQYASDMFETGSRLLDYVQDLLTLSKANTGYLDPLEKPVDLALVINKAVRFTTDKMQADGLNIKVIKQDPLPRLLADEFRLQQMLSNLLLYTCAHSVAEKGITLEVKLVNENKDKLFLAMVITNSGNTLAQGKLLDLSEQLIYSPPYQPTPTAVEALGEETNLSLELAKTLVRLNGGVVDVRKVAEDNLTITVLFAANRIRFQDAD